MLPRDVKTEFEDLEIKGTEDNNDPNAKEYIVYEVTADDIIPLTNSAIKPETEDDESSHELPPTTVEKAETSDEDEIIADGKIAWLCRICNQVFSTKLDLIFHKESVHAQKRVLQKYPCYLCKQVFDSKYKLGVHRNAEHGTAEYAKPTFKFDEARKLYICDICSAKYQNQIEIEKHLKKHEKSFKCTFCNKEFQRAFELGSHGVIHYDDKMFHCPLCIYKVATKETFRYHINSKHLKIFPYLCKECDKGFVSRVRYNKEHSNVHKGLRPFACVVCKSSFTQSRYLRKHQMHIHRVNIDGQLLTNQCAICKKVFYKRASLEKHVQNKHVNKPPKKEILCEICGLGFFQQCLLNAHYRTHTGDKPFTCEDCDRSFAKKSMLVVHIRRHTGEKPFACKYCEKRFAHKYAINVHQRQHTGEEPYSCKYCEKCFKQSATLKIHERTHTGETPYACQFCPKEFPSRTALNTHGKRCEGKI